MHNIGCEFAKLSPGLDLIDELLGKVVYILSSEIQNNWYLSYVPVYMFWKQN